VPTGHNFQDPACGAAIGLCWPSIAPSSIDYLPAENAPNPALANALLVPDTALGSDQSGRYVLVVTSENVVEQRKVQTGPLDTGLRVIETGLKPDDRVVVAGLLRVIPGQKVDPQLQKIESPSASAK